MQLTFGLRRARGFSSRLIEFFGAGFFSHVDIRDSAGWWWGARSEDTFAKGTWWPRGFQRRPPNYCRDPLWTFTIEVTEEQYRKFWNAVYKLEGVPYDWLAILAFAFPRISKFLKRNWRRLNCTFCSEAATFACEEGEIFGKLYEHVTKVTPGEFALMLVALKPKIERVPIVKRKTSH